MFVDDLERQGTFLFRYRSYAPLMLLPLAAVVVFDEHRWFVHPSAGRYAYEFGCLAVSLIGLIIRMLSLGYAAPGTSGRNTKAQVADTLNTTGMYSLCRHPLYLGNIMAILGILLFTQSVLFAAAGTLAYILFYERLIAAEERFLDSKYGAVFRDWAARIPALIPRLTGWKKPASSFSFRPGIKSELYGFTAVISCMAVISAVERFASGENMLFDPIWTWIFGITVILFFILRFIRKHTRVFESE